MNEQPVDLNKSAGDKQGKGAAQPDSHTFDNLSYTCWQQLLQVYSMLLVSCTNTTHAVRAGMSDVWHPLKTQLTWFVFEKTVLKLFVL